MLPMPHISLTTEYSATQLVYSKKFKLSHAIAPTRAKNGALHGMRLKMDLIGPKIDQKWLMREVILYFHKVRKE